MYRSTAVSGRDAAAILWRPQRNAYGDLLISAKTAQSTNKNTTTLRFSQSVQLRKQETRRYRVKEIAQLEKERKVKMESEFIVIWKFRR